jgi:sugar phosphate isomerase/epimerase
MRVQPASRRTFLKTGLVAAAASAPLTRALAAEPEPTVFGTPVGLQLYSLREHMPKDVPGTLAKIRAMGFREVEGGGDYGLGVAGFLGELKKADLRVTSALFGYEDWQKDKAARVARAREFGARYTGLAWIPHKQRFTREDALSAAANFDEWGAAAKAAGLRFVYHIHGYEFEASPEGTLFDTLAGQTDPANVAFEADIFWVRRGGCDPVALFERYPGRIATTHLKDIQKGIEVCKPDGTAPDETSVPLGEGMLDWPSVLRAAQKAGVERHYIEDEHPNALEQIPRSLKYLAAFRS